MALNFPSSPTTGQLYTDDNSRQWQYDGSSWAPVPLSQAIPSQNRNVIIGGDFTTNPWARGTNGVGVTNVYVADRFKYESVLSAGVVDYKKTADAPTAAEAGVYTADCLHIDCTTADTSIAAGEYSRVLQSIEGLTAARFGFGQASTRYVTLSFWHKHTITGTYCVALQNSAANRSYVAEYTQSVTNTWEKAEITIPVDTSGTWLYTNGVGVRVIFANACGSTYHTTAGSWAAGEYFATSNQVNNVSNAANDFKLALVQLEAGSVATDFESRDIGTELALCQRYFYRHIDGNSQRVAHCNQYAATAFAYGMVFYPVAMRDAPTTIASAAGHFTTTNASASTVCTSIAGSATTNRGVSLNGNTASGATGYQLLYATNASATLDFDAEL